MKTVNINMPFVPATIVKKKEELAEGDYKIIKAMENFLLTLPKEDLAKISEYDLRQVIDDRRTTRAQINQEEERFSRFLNPKNSQNK